MAEIFLDNKNPFVPERGLEASDYSSPENIRCPHCSVVGSFSVWGKPVKYLKTSVVEGSRAPCLVEISIRRCPNLDCGGLVALHRAANGYRKTFPPETIDFDPTEIPSDLLETLSEAIRCHASGSYRASAMMVRRLLEEICAKNNAEGANLHKRLGELKKQISLPDELYNAMFELKALGNDAAHVTATNYKSIGKEEAEDSIELVKEILKMRYQLKSLLERLQRRKQR